ncbi:surface lipoprotein assembly modifier [Catenovulum sediminis]|uniref:Surface lipoprotein assembly modifier n=1 Tax=Catenovulum sediminis TaxID=1740262 RepID=A0ABV1RFH1_9ALTE|nr:surface lipoprotein assembly modifier [Catenovulum sediminis]
MKTFTQTKLSMSLSVLISTALSTALATASFAQDKNKNWSISAETGYLHDSQLTIAELDGTASDQSDTALTLKVGADGKWQLTENTQISAGYQYNQKQFQDTQTYDTQMHQANIASRYALGVYRLGARLDYASIDLAEADLLDMTLLTLDIGRMLGDAVYLRGSTVLRDKSFADLSERDAQAVTIGADVFYFINMSQYLTASISHEDESADNTRFDYTEGKLKASFTQKFTVFEQTAKAQVYYQYSDRDYAAYAVNPDEFRADSKQTLGIQYNHPLSQYFEMYGKIEHTKAQSNLSSADYDENLASVNLKMHF